MVCPENSARLGQELTNCEVRTFPSLSFAVRPDDAAHTSVGVPIVRRIPEATVIP